MDFGSFGGGNTGEYVDGLVRVLLFCLSLFVWTVVFLRWSALLALLHLVLASLKSHSRRMFILNTTTLTMAISGKFMA